MILLSLFIVWLAYSLIEGIREALSDAGKFNYKPKHIIYTVTRIIVAGIIVAYIQSEINWHLITIAFGIALVLGFSFLHNGFYFLARNFFAQKKIYPKGFFDKGSSAIFEFSFVTRTIMFIISVLIVLFLILSL